MAYIKFSTPPAIGGITPNAGTFSSLNDTALTASRLLASDGSKNLTSVADLTTWVAGTSDRITSTSNGSGATTIDIAATYVGQTSITTLGTIATGTWNGTTIGVGFGGTGQTSYTNGQLLIGNSTGNTLTKATLTQGSGISITNGTGSITIALDSAAAVTSITATAPLTANGLSASAQTGAVTVALSTPLALSFGGTNANLTASNGGIFYSTATAGAILAGTATANKMLLSGASGAPSWSTSTIPSSAGATANKVLLSDGTNYVLSTPTFPNASATSGKIIISDGTNWIASTPTFPNAATSAGTILRADGTNWVATTATYPTTTTINQILYSSSANTITGITASNNGVLISGTGGIPSWLAAGSTGQVLVATTSNPPSWGTLSSLAVTSITGTANQVLANGTSGSTQTGAITLTLPQSIATSSSVQFGTMGLGAANGGGILDVQGSTSGSGAIYGSLLRTNVTETGSGSGTCGLFIGGTHTVNGSGTNTVSYLITTPAITATTTVSTASALLISAGSATGTINAAYGIYATNPGFGTAKAAIYADNLSVGYTATTPPTNGLIVSGNAAFGTSSVATNTSYTIAGATLIGNGGGSGRATNGLTVDKSYSTTFTANSDIADAGRFISITNESSTSGTYCALSFRPIITVTPNVLDFVYVANTTTTGTLNLQYTVNGAFTNRFAFTSSGQLGINIGTSTPQNNLDVIGNCAIGSYAGTLAAPSSGALISGNVGIGTGWTSSNSPNAVTDIWQSFSNTSYPTLHTLGVGATISTYGSASAAVSLTTTGDTNASASSVDFLVGSRFTVSSTVYVTHLGFAENAALTVFQSGTRDVGIYDATGTLLASTTISSATSSSSGFRYNALTNSIKLTAGQTYTILATSSAFQAVLSSGSTVTWASPFTFVSTVTKFNQTGLTYYTANDLAYSQGYGPALQFTTAEDTLTVINNQATILGHASINTASNVNVLDVSGAVAIGSYAAANTAPSNGLIVSGNTSIGTSSNTNKLDVSGALAIGTYAGVNTAPSNGLIVSGNTSIGTSSNTNKLDVSGALAIGTYAGVNTAPSNGLIVSGNVGIGGSSAGGYLDVQGSSSVSGAIYGTLLRTNLTETGSSSGTCAVFIGGTHTVNGSGTNTVAYMQVAPVVTATTTVSAAYGINLFPGSATGTVTAAYGLYAQNPGYGTTKAAIYTDNLSVGYTGTTPPSSGAIISGKVGIGTSSVDSSSFIEMTSSGPYTLRLAGTLTSTVNTQQASIWIRSALQPTSGNAGVSAHIFNQAFTIAPSGQTIANAAACYLAQDYEFNAGTITNAYQLLIATTASGTGTGSITNAYGAYITAPNAGTKICALYTDNLSVGYTATTPPTSGAIISGKVGIGTSAPASTTAALEVGTSTSSASTYNGILLAPTLTQTGNGQSTQIVQITGTQVVNGSGLNSSEFLRVFGQFTATTTINNAFGVHILASSGSGTINNGYGLFVENPGVGTTKTATYTENLSVGFAGVSPPTNGAMISGSVAIGTSSATTSALLTMSSTTKGFLRPAMTTTQKNAISSPASGLSVYDSTLNAVQVYNGSVWSTTGYAASSIVYVPVLSATGNAVNNGGIAGTNGWSATTNGTTVSNISSFINNAFGPSIQTTSVPTVNTYIQYNAGTGFANGIYLIRYILQSATDRAIVTVSEVTTATTIRSNYDTYSSSGASTNSIFEDRFLWTGGTGASMIIRWTGASKNASSSNYFILLANYFEIKRMG